MGVGQDYAVAVLPDALYDEIGLFLEEHPELGYRSRMEFCAAAVRDKLEEAEAHVREVLARRKRGVREAPPVFEPPEQGEKPIVKIPRQLCDWVDELVEKVPELGYPRRSEFCAVAVREKLRACQARVAGIAALRRRLGTSESDKLRGLREAKQRSRRSRRSPQEVEGA